MSINSIFCPRCGAESEDKTHFCRKCGTNLQIINNALAGSHITPQPVQPAKQSDDPIKELQRDMAWITIRGIVTLLLALPFFFLSILITINGLLGLLFGLPLTVVLFIFIVLGIRDLLKAHSTSKSPQAALAALKAQKEEKQVKDTGELFEPSVNPPASITENTTSLLKEISKKPDTLATKRFD